MHSLLSTTKRQHQWQILNMSSPSIGIRRLTHHLAEAAPALEAGSIRILLHIYMQQYPVFFSSWNSTGSKIRFRKTRIRPYS